MRTRLGLLLLALLPLACSPAPGTSGSADATPPTPAPSQTEPALTRIVGGMGIKNARFATPTLLSTGQISPSQLEALETLGFRKFISLRPADEEGTGWEEELSAAERIDFERIPVAGAGGLTRRNAERLAEALAEAEGNAVVYCASGNRVGALLALKACWLDGVPAREAMVMGREAGLAGLEPQVRELLELPDEDGS